VPDRQTGVTPRNPKGSSQLVVGRRGEQKTKTAKTFFFLKTPHANSMWDTCASFFHRCSCGGHRREEVEKKKKKKGEKRIKACSPASNVLRGERNPEWTSKYT
jgi:hypothetical protein